MFIALIRFFAILVASTVSSLYFYSAIMFLAPIRPKQFSSISIQ